MDNTFLKNSQKMYKILNDVKPTKITNQQLLDYHRKTHMLYSGNTARTLINKAFINHIVDLHDSFVTEILKRGMKHNTPLKKLT